MLLLLQDYFVIVYSVEKTHKFLTFTDYDFYIKRNSQTGSDSDLFSSASCVTVEF